MRESRQERLPKVLFKGKHNSPVEKFVGNSDFAY